MGDLSALVRAGAILVRAETRLPATLTAADSTAVNGWNLLTAWPSEAFYRILKEAGWKCFFIGGAMSVGASGRSVETVTAKLLDRITRTVERRDCNCFEVTEVAVTRALGFSNVRVDAQARHIQKGQGSTVAVGVTPE